MPIIETSHSEHNRNLSDSASRGFLENRRSRR